MHLNIKVEVSKETQIVVDRLTEAFPEEWLRDLAEETELVKRIRKFDPVVMFWILVLQVGVKSNQCFESLRRHYNQHAKQALAHASFYERFTPELVAFMHASVIRGIEHLASWSHLKLNESVQGFKDILILDSTVIRLHKKFAKKYPATRSRGIAAGIKLSCLMSVIADGPKRLRIFPERTPESKTLAIGPWVKDRILLIDLGFFKYWAFAKIKEHGGHFVSRLKDNSNPCIVQVLNTRRGNSIKVEGEHLQDVLGRLRRSVLDCMVEVDFMRRKYNGARRKDVVRLRLVAIRNKETGQYHTYVTTLTNLTAEEVARLYQCRWQVELLFRELKDKHRIDQVAFENEHAVEAFLWTSVLTLVVHRCLFLTALQTKPHMKEGYSHEKSAKMFHERQAAVLQLVLFHAYGISIDVQDIMEFEECGAFDRHGGGHRLREWAA